MYYRSNRRSALAAGVLLAGLTVASACGPVFPNTILGDPETELLRSPAACFWAELMLIEPGLTTNLKAVPARGDYARQTQQAETNDLEACYRADGDLTPVEKESLAAYAQSRDALARYTAESNLYATRQVGLLSEGTHAGPPVCPDVQVPGMLPPEFSAYLRGAIAWHGGDTETARDAWRDVLKRPAAERHYRSTWAAYMLGRSYLASDPDKAIEAFRLVRQLAREGFRDALGLATTSLGWEAYLALARRDFETATELYLLQRAAGDPTAVQSLQSVAAAIMRSGAVAQAGAAISPRLRPLVTAYVLAVHGGRHPGSTGPEPIGQWLDAVEAAKIDAVEGGDRLAWAAYWAGDMPGAKRWVQRAPEGAAAALWIRSKLALRNGDTVRAKVLLKRVLAGLPAEGSLQEEDAERKAAAELAALHMADGAYIAAMDLLVRNGWWWDAAYVAERVLTLDECQAYVDQNWAEDRRGYDTDGRLIRTSYWHEKTRPEAVPALIRYLLARRLARAQRFDEARDYYPPYWRQHIEGYAKQLREGADRHRPASARAESLWQAAQIARYTGMELFGTELEPDWFTLEGRYDPDPQGERRARAHAMKVAAPSQDELRRLRAQDDTHPTSRFHYRYAAAELGWQAAALMPNGSPETAEVLCRAGSWLQKRDPKAADRFYKALVTRCRSTPLGKEADRIRWFPEPAASAPE